MKSAPETSSKTPGAEPHLERRLTVLSATALNMANMIGVGPFITIWALNTLFPVLAIPYNIETYFAVIAMSVFFHANISSKD